MSKPLIKIHNTETGEIIEREMTDAEFAKHEIDNANSEAIKAEAEAKLSQRAALLERLGLTEEEARILLG